MKKRLLGIFALLLLYSFHASAQQKVVFGLGMLSNNYIGDFTYNEKDFLRVYPGVGLSAELLGNKTFKGQLNTGVGRFMEQNDKGFFPLGQTIEPNNFVSTLFFYIDWRLRMQIWQNSAFSPYISVGTGIFSFRPSSDLYKNLATNIYSRPEQNKYSVVIPTFPLSLGTRMELSNRFQIGLEYTYRITPTDYLDNVGQLGAMKGNDALQTLTATFYFSPQPQKTLEPNIPSIKDTTIFKPKKDTLKIDTTILANAKTKKPQKVSPPVADGDRGVKMARKNAQNIPLLARKELILAREIPHISPEKFKIAALDKSKDWLALNINLISETEKEGNMNKNLRQIKAWSYEFKAKKGNPNLRKANLENGYTQWNILNKELIQSVLAENKAKYLVNIQPLTYEVKAKKGNTNLRKVNLEYGYAQWDILNKELIKSALAEKNGTYPLFLPPLTVGIIKPVLSAKMRINPYPSMVYTVPNTEKKLISSTNNSYLHFEENKPTNWKESGEVWEIPIQDDLEGIWTRLAEEAAEANVWFSYNCLSDEQYEYIYIKFRVRKELIQKYNYLSGEVPNYGKIRIPNIRKWLVENPDLKELQPLVNELEEIPEEKD